MAAPLKLIHAELLEPLFEDLCQRYKPVQKIALKSVDLNAVFNGQPLHVPQTLEQMCQLAGRYFIYFSRLKPLPAHNLKVGLALTLTFLRLNEIELSAKELDLYQVALDTAYQELTPDDFSTFLHTHASCKSLSPVWTLQKI